MKKSRLSFAALIIMTYCTNNNISAQIDCKASANKLYESVLLREYKIEKIERGYEPAYVKDLKKGDVVTVLEIYKKYAVVIYESDTFTIDPKFLMSDCLSKKIAIHKEEESKKKREKGIKEQEKNREKAEEERIKAEAIRLTNLQASMQYLENRGKTIIQIAPVEVSIDMIATTLRGITSTKNVLLHTVEHPELVAYKGDTAFLINEGHLYATNIRNIKSSVADSIRNIQARKEKKKKSENLEKRKNRLISEHGSEIADLILSRKVRVGMTKEMAKASWGKPSDINRTINQYGTHEQWVYEGGSYLYFDDDKLTTIQN